MRTKTGIHKEQFSERAVQREHVSTDVGLIRTYKTGLLYYSGEQIARILTDVNGNEYVKTYAVLADFTATGNFTNDLTTYLIDSSDIQFKADKAGTGFTNQVASLDADGNIQPSGFNQSGLHTHANSAVLSALTDAGSGAVITGAERSKLNGIEASAKNNLIADVGATGVSVYRDQTGSTFNLRKLNSANNKIGIAINTDRVEFTLNEANISLNASQIVFTDTNSYLNATDIQAAIENLALQTRANTWRIGNEIAGDKYLRFAISAGPNDPGFRFLNSGTKLQYSNDGTTWNDFTPQILTNGVIAEGDIAFTGASPVDFLEANYRVVKTGKNVLIKAGFTYDSASAATLTGISIDIPGSVIPNLVGMMTVFDQIFGIGILYDGNTNKTHLFRTVLTFPVAGTARISFHPNDDVWTGIGVQHAIATISYESLT